ncbi:MAG: hypothetical protein PUG15_01175 [Bacteroidales bacterium]|nr:hypothetical protein [Bacteroidales bacterium]
MIDSVNFYKSFAGMRGDPLEILKYLEYESEKTDRFGKQFRTSTDGYKVLVTQQGALFVGSLAKSYFSGDNIKTLTRQTTKEAVERLNDMLHIDLTRSQINRLDIGANFLMKHPPVVYIGILGQCKGLERVKKQNSLYYNCNTYPKKTLIFYDKGKDGIAKNMANDLKEENLLRFELRFLNGLKKQTEAQTLADTYDPQIYYNNIQKWYEYYLKINKRKEIRLDMKSRKEMQDAMVASFVRSGLEQNPDFINDIIKKAKANNTLKDPREYSRIKAHFKNILNNNKITYESEMEKELNEKIRETAKYAR